MSDNQSLEQKLSDAKATAKSLLKKTHKSTHPAHVGAVEVAKTHSPKDIALWIFAVLCLIGTTLVGQLLPRYWSKANDIWMQIGLTVLLGVVAVVCLALTNQGKAFKTLLGDSTIELRRVTWPSKQETVTYTWQVLVVMALVGIFIWAIDNIFNQMIGWILG